MPSSSRVPSFPLAARLLLLLLLLPLTAVAGSPDQGSLFLLLSGVRANPINAAGTVYYVANDGDDSRSGTTAGQAWRTIAKVNAMTLAPGDAVLFRRGDEWRETLTIRSSGTAAKPIVFGNYGSADELPKILGSATLTEWHHVAGNIWVSAATTSDPSLGVNHDGSQRGSSGYPGGAWFEEFDGRVTWGNQEKYIDDEGDFAELTQPYDWGWFNGHIYVNASVNPGSAYRAVQVAQRQSAVRMPDNNPQHHIIIDGLALLYCQSKGFYGGYPAREAHGLTVRNSHVAYIGIKGGASAYGLAVWHSDMLIQHNDIHDCGRRSVSYNVYATRNVTFRNVTIENNRFHHGYHTTGLDIMVQGTDTFEQFLVRNNRFEGDPLVDLGAPGAFNSNHVWTQVEGGGTLTDFTFVNNIFTFCHGKGLTINGIANARVYYNTFYGVNPTLANYQAQLYFSGTVTNALVRNNIFFNDVDPNFNQYFLCVKADNDQLTGIDMDRNLYFTTDPDAAIAQVVGITGVYTMGEWSAYRSATGWESGSPVPDNPRFVNGPGDDFHLSSGSPAIGAGVSISGITTDYAGQSRYNPPALGAYRHAP